MAYFVQLFPFSVRGRMCGAVEIAQQVNLAQEVVELSEREVQPQKLINITNFLIYGTLQKVQRTLHVQP